MAANSSVLRRAPPAGGPTWPRPDASVPHADLPKPRTSRRRGAACLAKGQPPRLPSGAACQLKAGHCFRRRRVGGCCRRTRARGWAAVAASTSLAMSLQVRARGCWRRRRLRRTWRQRHASPYAVLRQPCWPPARRSDAAAPLPPQGRACLRCRSRSRFVRRGALARATRACQPPWQWRRATALAPPLTRRPACSQEGGWVLTVGFTLLFTALSALCAAYVVKAVQFFKARQAETRKLRTPEQGRQSQSPARTTDGEGDDLLELELLVRVTSSRPWWLVFQARARATPYPVRTAARARCRRRGGGHAQDAAAAARRPAKLRCGRGLGCVARAALGLRNRRRMPRCAPRCAAALRAARLGCRALAAAHSRNPLPTSHAPRLGASIAGQGFAYATRHVPCSRSGDVHPVHDHDGGVQHSRGCARYGRLDDPDVPQHLGAAGCAVQALWVRGVLPRA